MPFLSFRFDILFCNLYLFPYFYELGNLHIYYHGMDLKTILKSNYKHKWKT